MSKTVVLVILWMVVWVMGGLGLEHALETKTPFLIQMFCGIMGMAILTIARNSP